MRRVMGEKKRRGKMGVIGRRKRNGEGKNGEERGRGERRK